jgi:hypothetical protein
MLILTSYNRSNLIIDKSASFCTVLSESIRSFAEHSKWNSILLLSELVCVVTFYLCWWQLRNTSPQNSSVNRIPVCIVEFESKARIEYLQNQGRGRDVCGLLQSDIDLSHES